MAGFPCFRRLTFLGLGLVFLLLKPAQDEDWSSQPRKGCVPGREAQSGGLWCGNHGRPCAAVEEGLDGLAWLPQGAESSWEGAARPRAPPTHSDTTPRLACWIPQNVVDGGYPAAWHASSSRQWTWPTEGVGDEQGSILLVDCAQSLSAPRHQPNARPLTHARADATPCTGPMLQHRLRHTLGLTRAGLQPAQTRCCTAPMHTPCTCSLCRGGAAGRPVQERVPGGGGPRGGRCDCGQHLRIRGGRQDGEPGGATRTMVGHAWVLQLPRLVSTALP